MAELEVSINTGDIAPAIEAIRQEVERIKDENLTRFAKAFQLWEEGYRADPEKFMTPEETASAEVSQLSADRAADFAAFLAQVDKAEVAV